MKSLPIMTYVCDPNCGACCTHGIIEVDDLDIAREPRLKDACGAPAKAMSAHDYNEYNEDDNSNPVENIGPLVPGWEAGALLACGAGKPCQLLTLEKRCSIYATRPNVCVAFRAGSDLCQRYRGMAGLLRLQPVAVETVPAAVLKPHANGHCKTHLNGHGKTPGKASDKKPGGKEDRPEQPN